MGAATRFTQNPGDNAIAYYRYSSDAQRDVSIVQQQEAVRAYAKAHGYTIIKEYSDAAISGTRKDRPGFQTMLHEAKKLRPAYLILWKTDRLSRDKYDAVRAKDELRECGVKIIYVAESIPEDDKTAQILLESIYEAIAAAYIESHKANVVRGLTYNAANTLYNGIKILGYIGKPGHKYEVDEKTAPAVRQIFREYTEGVPLKKICDHLNDAGMRTVRGNLFTINSLYNILKNRAYIGEYKYGNNDEKKSIREFKFADGMPRLIDDETFQLAQDKLKATQRGGKAAVKKLNPELEIEDYLLTGKLYCGLCGGTMQGVSGTNKSGRLYYYYSCINNRKHKCSLKYKSKELLEKIVTYALDDLTHDAALRLLIAEKCFAYHQKQNDDGGAYEASVKAQLKEVTTKLNNVMKAVEAGIFNDTTAERMRELEAQKNALSDALLAEQNRQKYSLKLEDIVKFLDSFIGDPQEPETRSRLLEHCVDKIYVYPDKLVMTFYFTDDKRELPFEEMSHLMENQQDIDAMLDGRSDPACGAGALKSLIGNAGEDAPDFFP